MNTLRIAACCAVVGLMAADARAQLGTYGAPDSIAWGQDHVPAGGYPAVATRTTYVSTDDGSVSTQNVPQNNSGSGADALGARPAGRSGAGGNGAAGSSSTSVMPSSGYANTAASGESGDCCMNYCDCDCSPWYFSVDFLYMGRSRPTRSTFPHSRPALVNQGSFTDTGWTWGEQATIGYRFGCNCCWGIEGTYWGLAECDTDGGPGITGPYVTPMTMGLTDILGTTGGGGTGGAQTANNYTDNSPEHHIWREWEVNNMEVNFVRNVCGGPCNRVGIDFLCGFRWFHFRDGLVFGAERANDGSAYANDWLYVNDHIKNDLYGFQIGFDASYRFLDCWKAFIRPEFGVYGNHMQLDYNLYAVSSTTGQQFQGSSSTYANPNYPVHATTDGFSFLTQVDLGLDWQVTRHLSLQGGYRVVAVTGVGLADDQIPFFGNDTQAIADIQHSGSLIVDGVFGGGTITW